MSAMNYVVTLEDGTTTIILTTSPLGLAAFDPRSEDAKAEFVEHTLEVKVAGANGPANLSQGEAISKLLWQAAEAQENRNLAKVYVTFKRSASADKYRSEIVRGKATWSSNLLSLPYWRGDIAYLTLDIKRLNWWEGPESQIALTNDNGTDDFAGLNVFNANDGAGSSPNKRVNYVEIKAAHVLGTLPAATRLEVTNTYATSRLMDLFIGHTYINPNFLHALEVESALPTTGNTADANASGGEYKIVTVTSGSENAQFAWTITGGNFTIYAGQYFHGLMRFFEETSADDYKQTRFRLRLKWNATVVWEGPRRFLDPNFTTMLRDLGVFRLPPWLAGLSSLGSVDLELTTYQNTGGNLTIKPDVLHLMPALGWTHLLPRGYGVPQNFRIMDDGIDDRLYVDDGNDDNKVGILIRASGRPIQVYPGRLQRIYFAQTSVATVATEIARSLSVKLFYRPRLQSL